MRLVRYFLMGKLLLQGPWALFLKGYFCSEFSKNSQSNNLFKGIPAEVFPSQVVPLVGVVSARVDNKDNFLRIIAKVLVAF